MSVSVTMPALGESVTEGTITRWLKKEGDQVEVDEPLLEISTDKVDTEIPSPAAGVLARIVAAEDTTVAVGAELAVISDGSAEGGAPTGSATPAVSSAEPTEELAPGRHAAPDAKPSADGDGLGGGTPVTMPALGESVTEGTVTRWLKQIGDTVAVDEPLLEISTDKVDTEIPSPVAGTIVEIVAPEDSVVEIGGTLAIVGSKEATTAPSSPPASPPSADGSRPSAPREDASEKEVADNAGNAYITPLVRKLAAQHDINLSTIRGTGVGGRIRKQDILAAAEGNKTAATAAPQEPTPTQPMERKAPTPSPLRGRTEKLSRLRSIIARRMVESLQTTAQLTAVLEVDVTRIARLRDATKADFAAKHGVKLSFMPFFAIAAVEALREHPKLNSSIDLEAGTITYHDAEHLGIAVDTERGLIVPVIRDAGDLNLGGIARKIADLAERARTNKLSPDELAGGTFTLTNTGSRGALFDTPILNLPQTAILGTGAVVKRAVVVDDENLGELILPRSMVYLSLTYDHRVVDGADAARYLVSVKDRLENGAFEADLGLG